MIQSIKIVQQKSDGQRQVQMAGLVLSVFGTKEEAITYAIESPYGKVIQVFDNGETEIIEK